MLIPLQYRVTLPVADIAPLLNLGRAMLDTHAIRYLAKPCAFGVSTVLAASLGLPEMLPKSAARALSSQTRE
ncbi:hypothetical protein GCM10027172_01260 [Halomonas garicola]